MKKESVKVLVINAKHAVQLQYMLEVFKETIDKDNFSFYSEEEMYLILDGKAWMLINKKHSRKNEFETITPIELINLLSNQVAKEPIITTEDGVPLYDGDNLVVIVCTHGQWHFHNREAKCSLAWSHSGGYKFFAYPQSAESWMDLANNPKEIKIDYDDTCGVVVKEDAVHVEVYKPKGMAFFITKDKLIEMYNAMMSLQKITID